MRKAYYRGPRPERRWFDDPPVIESRPSISQTVPDDMMSAYHEAGHGVVGLLLDVGCHSIEITGGGRRGGLWRSHPPAAPTSTGAQTFAVIASRAAAVAPKQIQTTRKHFRSQLIAIAAGRAAQKRFLGPSDARYEEGCGPDDEQIAEIARPLTTSTADLDNFLREIAHAADRVVAHYWEPICRVAGKLYAQLYLSGSDVVRVADFPPVPVAASSSRVDVKAGSFITDRIDGRVRSMSASAPASSPYTATTRLAGLVHQGGWRPFYPDYDGCR
jgi:hypothetical protein